MQIPHLGTAASRLAAGAIVLAALLVVSLFTWASVTRSSEIVPATFGSSSIAETGLIQQPCTNRSQCDDRNLCNGVEDCSIPPGLSRGLCVSGPQPQCWVNGQSCHPTHGCFDPNILCNLSTDCPLWATCGSNGRCVPTDFCNQNADCPDGTNCESGRCVGTPAPCQSSANCSGGLVCDRGKGRCIPCTADSECSGAGMICDTARGKCAKGCRQNADCDDGKPCNGVETCDGIACKPGDPLNCDDNDPFTDDYCDDNRTRPCVNSRRGNCRKIGVSDATLTATRSLTPIGVSGYTLRARMHTMFRPNSPIDPSRGKIEIKLVDEYGTQFLGESVDSKAVSRWSYNAKDRRWTYSSPDAKAGIQKIIISRSRDRLEAFDFEIQGQFASPLVPDLRSLKPAAALLVTWTGDIAGPCATVVIPECGWRTSPTFGEQLFCRGDQPRGPGFR